MDRRIEVSINALKQYAAKSAEGRKVLPLGEADETVLLQMANVKLPATTQIQTIKIPILRPFRSHNDVCLFVKDLQRGLRVDHERSAQHWQEVLRCANVTRVNKVMPLRELRAEYGTFEARRKLCDSYDVFLTDTNLFSMLPAYIGKHFYKKHKIPIRVNLSSSDLAGHIDNCIDTAYLRMFNTGASSSVEIGSLSQSTEDLLLNIATAVDVLSVKSPGGLRNIRSIHIKLRRSPALPVYINNRSSNLVPRPKAPSRPWLDRKPVRGELSTSDGDSEVIVYPNGDVMLADELEQESKEEDIDSSTEQSKKVARSKKVRGLRRFYKNSKAKKFGSNTKYSEKRLKRKRTEDNDKSKKNNSSNEESKKRKVSKKISKNVEQPKSNKSTASKWLKKKSESPGKFVKLAKKSVKA